MKEKYITPVCEVIIFADEDVITTSGTPFAINLDEFYGDEDNSGIGLPGYSYKGE